MTLIYFLKLIYKNLKWLILLPGILAGTIYYLTRHEVKVYASETVIYTGIASGYNLSGSSKADFWNTSTAFDNLISIINSRETKKMVAINLLAQNLMLKKHNPEYLEWESYQSLKKSVSDSVRNIVVKPTLKETRDAVYQYYNNNENIGNNIIYKLVNSTNPFYSVNALQNIKAMRVSNSDLIKISYSTNDAAICKHTLDLLIEVFMQKQRLLREGQTESVVAYFENETRKSYQRLDSTEQEFLKFHVNNDIINYYEQTKAVAGEREDLYALNHNLEMDSKAQGTALNTVNESIKGRMYQSIYGAEILNQRQQLSDIYNKIAVVEVLSKDSSGSNKNLLDSLRLVATRIGQSLKTSITNLNAETNTPNGIPTKDVLDEWLKTTMAYEESKARLTVMDKRKQEFEDEYKKFAPLGAQLKKIERQISVFENEYLELLHGLSLARLAQQNNELTSKLTIVDPPFLPLNPDASKRMILVIAGFMVGFFFVLAFVLAKALANKTVRDAYRAYKIIKLPVLGIYPLLSSSSTYLEKSNLRLVQQLLTTIDLKDKPYNIGIISIQKKEGKSYIVELFKQQLESLQYAVEIIQWQKNNMPSAKPGTDIVFYEFPALEEAIIQPGTCPTLHQTFLICRANRIWIKLDEDLLTAFSKSSQTKPMLILNGVSVDFAEEFIGEVPKNRNIIRNYFKKIVKFEFGNRKALKKVR